MVTNNYLFVYGTLLDGGNEFGNYLKNNCSFYGEGKFKGLLYYVEEYPGAVLVDGKTYVHGQIFLMRNADEVLERLDDYEGYGPEQEQPNLFVREVVEVECGSGMLLCWCYLYNREVDGLRLIGSGIIGGIV